MPVNHPRAEKPSDDRNARFERSGEIPLYDLTITVDETDRRILEQEAGENVDQWISDAIRHRLMTSNLLEVLPITDAEVRGKLNEGERGES